MKRLLRAFGFGIGFGSTVSLAIAASGAMVFGGGRVLLDFNHFGEGWLEVALLWSTLVGWTFGLLRTPEPECDRYHALDDADDDARLGGTD